MTSCGCTLPSITAWTKENVNACNKLTVLLFPYFQKPHKLLWRALMLLEHPVGTGRCPPRCIEQKNPSSTFGPGSSPPTKPCGPSLTTFICMPRLEMMLKALHTPAIPSKMAELSRDGALTHTFHTSLARLVTATLVWCWSYSELANAREQPESSSFF